jgi:NitT/TauT family transport system substrate-binding protein
MVSMRGATRVRLPVPDMQRVMSMAVALGVLLLPALGAHAQQQKRQITFGLPVAAINASYCMFAAAVRMGFLADEGIEVKYQLIPGSTEVVQTVMSGRLDVGGATPEPVFKSVSQDQDVIMFYDFVRAPTGSIAVLDTSPIRKIDEFRNKKLGAQSLGSGNIMLTNAILSSLGIDPKTEVSYISVGAGAQALQALRSRHVDGLILFDSMYAQMENMGAKLRYFYGSGQEKLFSTQLVMRRSRLESDSKLAQGVGRAIAKATVVAKENPAACIRMLWQQFPASRVAGMSEEEQLKNDLTILTKRMELMVNRDSAANGWGYYSRADIDAWNAFAVQGGIIEKKLENVDAAYTNKFVADFNRFDAAEIVKRAKAWRE